MDLRRINFPILLLSFGLSLILWSYVKTLNRPEAKASGTFTLTTIETRNLPPGSALVGAIPPSVTFTAIGAEEERTRIDAKNLKAYIDFARPARDGRFVVRLEAPVDYNVAWTPKEVPTTLKLEEETSSTLPITVEAVGQFTMQNFRYDGATTEPAAITFTGAKSYVEKVKKVRAYLNLADVQGQNAVRSKIELLDENGIPVSGVRPSAEEVSIRAIVAPRPPRRSLLIQPVWHGVPQFGFTISDYAITPAQVSVEGPADVLANLSVINTKPIEIEGIHETATVSVELDLPPGIRLTRPEPISIKIYIKSSGTSPPTNDSGNP